MPDEVTGIPQDNADKRENAGDSKGTKKVDQRNSLASKRTDMASDRTDMALTRTTMAADRTLLSWMRTSLSLMSFGFTIYKFLIYLVQLQSSPGQLTNPDGPRQLGIIMIGSSILCIVLGMIEYYDIYKRFGKQQHQRLWGTAFIMALLTALLASLLLVLVITKTA
jgi:putative membrane protein